LGEGRGRTESSRAQIARPTNSAGVGAAVGVGVGGTGAGAGAGVVGRLRLRLCGEEGDVVGAAAVPSVGGAEVLSPFAGARGGRLGVASCGGGGGGGASGGQDMAAGSGLRGAGRVCEYV
jgi:hypothetical protein